MAEPLKCPDCGSTNIFYDYTVKAYTCLSCGRKWPREKAIEKKVAEEPPTEEEEEKTYLIRDETMMEVETEEGLTLEEPVETSVEES